MRNISYFWSGANIMTKQDGPILIKPLGPDDIHQNMDGLSDILQSCVNSGAAVGFIQPFSKNDACAFWWNTVLPTVQNKQRILLGAFKADLPIGTVQLVLDLPPNQPKRSEVAKLIVHTNHRKQGVAKLLMQALEDHARQVKKTLITLDTKTGDTAEKMYKSLGFKTAGIIPNFALDPDGQNQHATTYMYKNI